VNTIGPKYSTSDPKSLIASDFYRNLKLLEIVGTLKANSPFFVAAIASLESYLKSPGSNKLSPPLDYLNKASTGLESEIAAAMRLSL